MNRTRKNLLRIFLQWDYPNYVNVHSSRILLNFDCLPSHQHYIEKRYHSCINKKPEDTGLKNYLHQQTRYMRNVRKKPKAFFTDQQLRVLDVRDVAIVSEQPYTARFKARGLNFESFNNFGNPKMQSLLTNGTISRYHLYNKAYNAAGMTFMDLQDVIHDRFTFMSSTEASFSKEIYDPKVDKSQFDAKLSLGYLGNSSIATVTEYFESGKVDKAPPLLRKISQMVSICKDTRKPITFPDWFQEKFKGKGVLDQGLVLKPFERAENSYVHNIKVRWYDTDNYNHTNFTSYITFAESAIHYALQHHPEILGNLTLEDFSSGCKNIKISYQNESLEGQLLQCHVWQDDSCAILCSIERDDTVLCQLVFRY